MRFARMLLAAALTLVFAWPSRGDSVPVEAPVKTDKAAVRCKPSSDATAYITQTLPKGTPVNVVEKGADGWLKIEPPDDSISWIANQTLRASTVAGVFIVKEKNPVNVLVGPTLATDKPVVIGAQLSRGAQVIARGQVKTWDGTEYLPILSPPGEYRYIQAQDVSELPATLVAAHATAPGVLPPVGAPGTVLPVSASSPAPAPAPAPDNAVHVPAPASAPVVDPLLQQADQLERSGDKIGAARVYEQLGCKYLSSNREASLQYYNRAAWSRSTAAPGAAAPTNDADALYQQARQYEQGGNRTDAARLYMKLGDLFKDSDYQLAMKYYHHAGWLRQSAAAPRPNPPTTTTAGASPQPATPTLPVPQTVSVDMIGPGLLRHSAVPIDGRPTYVLETPQAQVIAYLTAQPGVELERYVNQNVELLGDSVPRTDVAGKFMSVIRVRPLPTQ